jgi:hypothetical protein
LPKHFWDEILEQSKAYEHHESDLEVGQMEEDMGRRIFMNRKNI